MYARTIFIVAMLCSCGFGCAGARNSPAQSSRSAVELNSGWRFQLDELDLGQKENWQASTFDRSQWTPVRVPMAWDLFDRAMWNYEGVGWFSLDMPAARSAPGAVRLLRFGRVNYHTKVWLNGQSLGENVNGYLPFQFDVTDK